MRRLVLPLALLVVGLPVGILAVMAMGHDEAPKEATDSFRPISKGAVPRAERHSQGRWERVTSFAGTGSATRSFAVADGAIQWRAGWRCSMGKLRLTAGRGAEKDKVLADTSCPDNGSQTATGEGPGRLRVDASAPWRVSVSQQVDTALEERPLAGMTKGTLLSRGRVRPVQKKGEGTVSLFRLPSGRLALRFKDFYTSPSPGLELWLSEADNPNSTLDARDSPHQNAGHPRSTYGNYNQLLARGVDANKVKSIVVWCPAVTIAFSAATLRAP